MEQSPGLTGCSFTGLGVRCQSSVREGESRGGLSTVPQSVGGGVLCGVGWKGVRPTQWSTHL